jgi:hypothetical protein
MGMQPVKGIEKAKKDSDKGGEANKAVKGVELMSLIAKTVRGMKKMDATGEKMKKIAMKESFASWLSDKRGEEMASASSSEIHNGFKVGDTVKVNSEAASSLGIDPNDVYKIKSFTKIRPGSLMQSVDATIVDDQGTTFTVNVEYLYESGKIANTVFNKNAGITAGLKSLTKDDLMEMIREELNEALGIGSGDNVTDVAGHQLDEIDFNQIAMGNMGNNQPSQPKASFEGKWTDIKDKNEFINKFHISNTSPLVDIVARAIGSNSNYAITNKDGKFYVYTFTQTANPGKPSQSFNSLEDAKKSVKL